MKIKLTRAAVIDDVVHDAGETVEVPERFGNTLISMGKAIGMENDSTENDSTENDSTENAPKSGKAKR